MGTEHERTSDGELVWWDEANGRYYAWAARSGGSATAASSDGTRVALVSLDGARREVDLATCGAHELREAQVVAALAPVGRAALDAITATLAGLDPSFAGLDRLQDLAAAGPEIDVQAAVERLIGRLGKTPDLLHAPFDKLVTAVETLRRLLSFGRIGRPLLESLGLGPTTLATPGPTEESSQAMVERVRKSVSAELEAHMAARPPMSFDFQDLVGRRP